MSDGTAEAVRPLVEWLVRVGTGPEVDGVTSIFAAVLEHLPVGVIVAEAPSGRIVFANRHVDEIWRRPHVPLAAEDCPIARALRSGEVVSNEELRIVRGDGTVGTVSASAAPVRGVDGAIVAAIAAYSDVSAVKAAEITAHRATTRTRLLEELTAALASATTSREIGRTIVEELRSRAGAFVAAVLGATADGTALEHLASFGLSSAQLDGVQRASLELVAANRDRMRPTEPVFASGWTAVRERLPFLAESAHAFAALPSIVALPLVADGRVVGVLWCAFSHERDFSPPDRELFATIGRQCAQALDRARLLGNERAALRRSAQLEGISAALARAATVPEVAAVVANAVRAVLDASCAGIVLVDPEAQALELIGPAGLDEHDRRRLARTPLDRSTPAGEAILDRVAVVVESLADDERRYGNAGARRWNGGTRAALPLVVDGRVPGALVFAYERWRRLEPSERELAATIAAVCAQALERARLFEAEQRARAESVERARLHAVEARRKDDFLAMLAHELRNPLTPVRAAVELLRASGTSDDIRARCVEAIDRQTTHLVRLVDDLLDLSRIERGKIVLRTERIDLAAIVDGVIATYRPTIERKRQVLSADVRGPVAVTGDADRLTQVVGNLLGNAAKFTPEGGTIAVALWVEGERAVLRIRDDGPGIEPELLPAIFDPFVQADRSLDRAAGGLGVGLTVARDIVALHRGSIEARSEGVGRGTELVVRLPLGSSHESVRPEDERACGGNLTILLVEDNAETSVLLAELLRADGHEVYTAGDGHTAVARFVEHRPRAIVMDLGLPGLDGFEVARRIRAMDASVPQPVLIALTGYTADAHREQARAAGIDHHMAKPPDVRALRSILARIGARVISG